MAGYRRASTDRRLARAVADQFGWDNCPCCGVRMREVRPKPGRVAPPDARTLAHDEAVARGGDVNSFVWACTRCNGEQGPLSFEVWARKLGLAGDERATRVLALVAFIRAWKLRDDQ